MPVPLLLLPPFLVVLPVIGMNHHQIAIANRCAMMTGNPNYGFTPKVHSLSSSGLEMDGDADFNGNQEPSSNGNDLRGNCIFRLISSTNNMS